MASRKTRACRRCGASIRPDYDSHASLTLRLRHCNPDTGAWHEAAYKPMHLCADCWGLADDLIAGVSRG